MSYQGSKAASGVYQKIIAEISPHDTYINDQHHIKRKTLRWQAKYAALPPAE